MIEAYLTDASGFRWQIVEKTIVFHEWEAFESDPPPLPTEVSIECRVSMDSGGATISIYLPDVGDRVYEIRRGALIAN